VLARDLGLNLKPSFHLLGPAVGTHYAVTGARASGKTPIVLKAQITAFLLNSGGIAPSNAFYVVFIGGKDVRDGGDEIDDVAALSILTDAVNGIGLEASARW
jgi:hypothetical protein